jgi:hypothetical protein
MIVERFVLRRHAAGVLLGVACCETGLCLIILLTIRQWTSDRDGGETSS